MEKIVMGYWDCPVCGNREIRGDVVNCPSCGRARGDVKFYMKGVAEGETREENERGDIEYLSEEQAASVSKNPDWYCSFCNSLNSDNAAFCGNCGASRESSEANYFDRLRKKQEEEAAELAARPQPAARTGSSRKQLTRVFIIAAIALAVIIGLVTWLNGSRTSGGLQVSALEWHRVIHVERYVSESDWSLPSGADLDRTQTETRMENETRYRSEQVQRSRRVVDHYETYYSYEDNGNGTFREVAHQRPVYTTETYWETVQVPYVVQVPRQRTKYYYHIWRRDPSLDLRAAGSSHETYWPEVQLEEGQREAALNSREAEYRFTVVDTQNEKAAPVTYRVTEEVWMTLNQGDTVFITAKRSGADPFLSDQSGNKIADIVRVR